MGANPGLTATARPDTESIVTTSVSRLYQRQSGDPLRVVDIERAP
jgi:hypothetical protein